MRVARSTIAYVPPDASVSAVGLSSRPVPCPPGGGGERLRCIRSAVRITIKNGPRIAEAASARRHNHITIRRQANDEEDGGAPGGAQAGSRGVCVVPVARARTGRFAVGGDRNSRASVGRGSEVRVVTQAVQRTGPCRCPSGRIGKCLW